MSQGPRIRVYLACSLDGYIAGPDDDLSWLQPPPDPPDAPPVPEGALTFEAFMAQVGAMLMGRRTYDVVAAFEGWPYGEVPVLVATHRPLDPAVPTVRAVEGDISELLDQARAAAGTGDVYLDGGLLARQALDAGLVDEMVLTMVPTILGGGVRLFDGLQARQDWDFVSHAPYGHHMVQLTLKPRDKAQAG